MPSISRTRALLSLTGLLLAMLALLAELQPVHAAVVPGRMLNKGHEEVFAAQIKENERTKQRERKPVSPTFAKARMGWSRPTLLRRRLQPPSKAASTW